MAKFAYRKPLDDPGKEVDAEKLPLHGNPIFYCTTPGCTARMFVRSPQKPSACFVSYDIKEHTGGYICSRSGSFHPDRYDESLFDVKRAFKQILSPVSHNNSSGNGYGGIGQNRRIAIRTLKTMYEMCLQFRPLY